MTMRGSLAACMSMRGISWNVDLGTDRLRLGGVAVAIVSMLRICVRPINETCNQMLDSP